MAYEPTNWKTGDVVTSEKLNKIEQGIAGGGGVLVAHYTVEGTTLTLDKTYAELLEASESGIVIAIHDESYEPGFSRFISVLVSVNHVDEYDALFYSPDGTYDFLANADNVLMTCEVE